MRSCRSWNWLRHGSPVHSRFRDGDEEQEDNESAKQQGDDPCARSLALADQFKLAIGKFGPLVGRRQPASPAGRAAILVLSAHASHRSATSTAKSAKR